MRSPLPCLIVAIACQVVSPLPTFANARAVMRGVPVEAEASTSFHTLYNFPKGSNPTGLSSVNGMLFGTSYFGEPQVNGSGGYVYAATTAGSVSNLYTFTSAPDGANPGEVTASDGVLYGVTLFGGDTAPGNSAGCGTFFAVPYAGGETVSAFKCGMSGAAPNGKLLHYNGAFFGETDNGGIKNNGTIFVAHGDGTIKVLYRFGGATGGSKPEGGLEELDGTLYGVTGYGGTHNQGTIFSMLPSGAVTVIHNFEGTEGSFPGQRLTAVNGVLYGSATYGGANGRGTIFAITPSGSFKVLHSFTLSPDGNYPGSSLLAFGGALIGTTYGGGLHDHGLLFKISYDGVLKRLHSFEKTEGTGPAGQLTCVGDTIYGTTEHDGANSGGTLYGFKL